MTTPVKIADEIISLYQTNGLDNYGENISQLEHAFQTALIAMKKGEEEELILAAFLHDIGHLIESDNKTPLGVMDHELMGAKYLKDRGFSDKIVNLVFNHVNAKRYKCSGSQDYIEKLSDASRATLILQGGTMKSDEIIAFEENPDFYQILLLRQWDEDAKEPAMHLPDISIIRSMIIRHLLRK